MKVSDEVALQMRSVRKELESQKESRRSSRRCSVKKQYEEDLQRKTKSHKAIIRSDRPSPEKEVKTERLGPSDNALKVEL